LIDWQKLSKLVEYWQRSLSVDANEFLKKVTPAGQRSRLAPFWNDITKLRQSGCTLEQVCEFLATNGVQMSIAGLSKYIKRREEKSQIRNPHLVMTKNKQRPSRSQPKHRKRNPQKSLKHASRTRPMFARHLGGKSISKTTETTRNKS
jgi:hypothetical protein